MLCKEVQENKVQLNEELAEPIPEMRTEQNHWVPHHGGSKGRGSGVQMTTAGKRGLKEGGVRTGRHANRQTLQKLKL